MITNFDQLSIDARASFENELNYEKHFNSVMTNHFQPKNNSRP
jgi:hypothetical protein